MQYFLLVLIQGHVDEGDAPHNAPDPSDDEGRSDGLQQRRQKCVARRPPPTGVLCPEAAQRGQAAEQGACMDGERCVFPRPLFKRIIPPTNVSRSNFSTGLKEKPLADKQRKFPLTAVKHLGHCNSFR